MIKVQHSIVSPDGLLEVIQQHYPGIFASACELLALGCNDNYYDFHMGFIRNWVKQHKEGL